MQISEPVLPLAVAILVLVAALAALFAWFVAPWIERLVAAGRSTACCDRREPTFACGTGRTESSELRLELMTVPTGKRFVLETVAMNVHLWGLRDPAVVRRALLRAGSKTLQLGLLHTSSYKPSETWSGTFGVRAYFEAGDTLEIEVGAHSQPWGASADVYGYFIDATGPLGV